MGSFLILFSPGFFLKRKKKNNPPKIKKNFSDFGIRIRKLFVTLEK